MIQKEYFKKASTRELLALRRSVSIQKYPRFDGDEKITFGRSWYAWMGYEVDTESLYKELSTRPHVASGKEAKLLRQLKASTKQSEKEIRENPKYKKMLADAEKSEETPKIKKPVEKELHWFVKKLCKENKLQPTNPKIKEMILKSLEDCKHIDFDDEDNPLYFLMITPKYELKKLKNGNYYI